MKLKLIIPIILSLSFAGSGSSTASTTKTTTTKPKIKSTPIKSTPKIHKAKAKVQNTKKTNTAVPAKATPTKATSKTPTKKAGEPLSTTPSVIESEKKTETLTKVSETPEMLNELNNAEVTSSGRLTDVSDHDFNIYNVIGGIALLLAGFAWVYAYRRHKEVVSILKELNDSVGNEKARSMLDGNCLGKFDKKPKREKKKIERNKAS